MKKIFPFRFILILSFLFSLNQSYGQDLILSTPSSFICEGEEFLLEIAGGELPYVIDWGDGTTFVSDQSSNFHVYFGAGAYQLTVTDDVGDQASITIIINSCNIQIFGNLTPCVGDCEFYEVIGGFPPYAYQISLNGNIVSSLPEICFEFPGLYEISVFDANGITGFQTITVSDASVPTDIVSLSNTFCAADSLNPTSCEKICANSTAIYTVPNGQNVIWEVLGADNFSANGNQVTVDWGAPGSGSVTAISSTSGGSDLSVSCGSQVFQDNQFDLYSNASGGTPPYSYTWTGTTGFTSTSQNMSSLFLVTSASYTVIVTDATGNTASCETHIVAEGQCLFSYTVTGQDESQCGFCDGSASVEASSPFSNNFTFIWANGTTTQSISGLCAGTYSVTIVDDFGCSGSGDFTVGCPSFATCPSTSSICVDILEEPAANVTTIPPAVNGVVSICEGGTVVFNNESLGASSYEWSFGNGNVSTSVNAEQTYLTAGTYDVYLISRNDCYCADTTFLTIDVANAINPGLDCVGTICESETVTYTTDANCGTFTWNITGDYNIVDGGSTTDNFITIEWLTGPEGIIELGVDGCTGGNYCLEPTVEVVPIISDNAIIKGPDKVCRYDEATYFIDDYSASDFIWTVSFGGTILEGQNTNSIKVRWEGNASANVQQWVSVDYTNCYLGCGGSDTKDVYILPELYLEGDIEACANGMSTFFAKKDAVGANNISCNWTVTSGAGSVVWTSPSPNYTVDLDWNTIAAGSGRYAVTAIPVNPLEVCSDEFTSYINLIQPPNAPNSITGETQICPGEFYTYEVNSTNPDYIFDWTINDGGNISTQSGKSINVSFGSSPPYILSVKQTSTDGLACESPATSLEVFPITSFTAVGDLDVCIETEGNYSAQLFTGVGYTWEIIPSDAGTIIDGQNTNAIEVLWHQEGNAEVVANMCNITQTVPVNVIGKPQPVIDGDLEICPGETTIVGTTIPFNTYRWITESGNLITNTATVELPAGAFELVVTNSFGCEKNIAFEVIGFEEPEVSISVFGSRGRCYQGANPDPPAEIHALEVPAGYTYQWFFQGSPIAGSNSSILTTSDFGTFQVSVIDQNGCETFSNTINIFSFCSSTGTGGGPPVNNPPVSNCGPGTDVVMDFTLASECNKVNFFNNSGVGIDVSTIQWDFGDPASGFGNTSVDENPVHTFSGPGHYVVTFEAENSAGVVCWDTRIVTVPITANFTFGNACVNELLEFEDLSAFVPGESIDTWFWDFGEPSSGTNNTSTDQHPSHAYATTGTFDVTLTVGHASGCQVSIVRTVSIEAPPTINFAEPTINCQGTALSFIAQPSADVLFFSWDFGEPSSGAANTSELQNPVHAYATSGNFTVQCTVTDIWGCSSNFSRVISVTPNSLSGVISFSTPSPICDGDVTTLVPPPGGASWEWSDGSTNETLITGEAGTYSVTVTNDIGCEYVSPTVVLDIIPLPTSTIQAIEYDEFGQPVNVFYDNYSTCEGEDVFMQVVQNADYTYTWSNGISGHELEFSEDRGNQLTAGTYTFTLDILDNSTGCSNTVGPFDIVIHPTPTGVSIFSNPISPCENTLTTIEVSFPQPDLTYVWNTGEISNSIQVSAGGEYFVRAISTFGCVGESNKIEILKGPDIKKIPDGCHSRCKPDTICLPTINGVSSYQWYLDGVAIPGPNGTIGDLIAEESGAYHVVMTDIYGCETTSDILNLDLFDGFGTFNGNVYMDVNENGIIDGPDTLVSGINIIITENGIPIDTTTTDVDGAYSFPNILATNYNLQVDINGLPGNVIAVYNNIDTALVGCDDQEVVDWLLQINCPALTASLAENICNGEQFIYEGVVVTPGVPTDFTLQSSLGCDSIVTVTITELPDLNTTTTLSTCGGNDVTYNGMTLTAGSTTDFALTSPEGCDYTETVNVISSPTSTEAVAIEICAGEVAIFDGTQLVLDTPTEFPYVNQFGCDSIIMVTATQLPDLTTMTILNACAGTTIMYNGSTLPAGSITELELTSPDGCDYIETVEVAPFPTSSEAFALEVCVGETPMFDGTQLTIGVPTEFPYLNQFGCDSIVTVTASELPDLTTTTSLNACDGNDVVYNGMTLIAGSTTEFAMTSPDGCDYIETVEVVPFPTSSINLTLEVCSGEIAIFDGQELAIGSQTEFPYLNQFGCDSIVMVSVSAFPEIQFDIQTDVPCWNGSDGVITIMNTSGTGPLEFSLDGNNFQAAPIFEDLPSQNYMVHVKDGNGCEMEEPVTLNAIPPLQVEVLASLLPCDGGSANLQAQVLSGNATNVTYEWSDGSTEPSTSVSDAGIYFVSATNECETIVEEVNVSYEEQGRTSYIYVPNAFSPNGDGYNDVFKVLPSNEVLIESFDFYIFDRWGNHLYETHSVDEGWDGRLDNKVLDPGVCVYYIRANITTCGRTFEIFRKGDVTIMK